MSMKRTVNRSLLSRALLSNFALVGVLVTLLTGLFLLVQLRGFRIQMDLQAKVLARLVSTQSELAMLVGDRPALEIIAGNVLSIEDVLFVVLTDHSGESIRVSRPGFPIEKIPPSSAGEQNPLIFEVVEPVLPRKGSSIVEWDNKNVPADRLGTVRIGFSLEGQQKLRSRTLRFAVPIVLLSLIVILAVQYAQLRRLLEPLKGLIAFTKQVGQGERLLRAPVARHDEVGRLAEAF